MNYPLGAAYDPNAPWNQPLDPEPRYTEQLNRILVRCADILRARADIGY